VDIREPLSEEELTQLTARNTDIHLARGEELHCREEHDSGLFLIKSGRVQAYRLSVSGKPLTVAMFSSGSVLGGRRMREMYAQAMEPSVVCFVRRRDLERLVGRRPELGLRLIDLLSDDLRMMDELLYDVVYKEVPARLASLILRLLGSEGVVNREGYKIPTYYTHAQLGSMIGARRVAVTRALGHLRQAGMVETTQSGIRVRDADTLERAAAEEK
jgi:CRP/FNR family transcriptional regulator, cyclic AMP receptor protein